ESATGRQVFCSPAQETYLCDVMFAPDGKTFLVAFAAINPIRVFDFPSGRERMRFGGDRHRTDWLRLTVDGKTVVTTDGVVRLTKGDVKPGHRMQTIRTDMDRPTDADTRQLVLAPCFSWDGRLLAAIIHEYKDQQLIRRTQLRVWDSVTGQELPSLDGQE